jgi:hypothetical protein
MESDKQKISINTGTVPICILPERSYRTYAPMFNYENSELMLDNRFVPFFIQKQNIQVLRGGCVLQSGSTQEKEPNFKDARLKQ